MKTCSALYSLDDLIEMKRSELQRLAKMYNIKANQKVRQGPGQALLAPSMYTVGPDLVPFFAKQTL